MSKVGRNDPCPCGSGKKYKQCHLPLEEAARAEKKPEPIAEPALAHAVEDRKAAHWKVVGGAGAVLLLAAVAVGFGTESVADGLTLFLAGGLALAVYAVARMPSPVATEADHDAADGNSGGDSGGEAV